MSTSSTCLDSSPALASPSTHQHSISGMDTSMYDHLTLQPLPSNPSEWVDAEEGAPMEDCVLFPPVKMTSHPACQLSAPLRQQSRSHYQARSSIPEHLAGDQNMKNYWTNLGARSGLKHNMDDTKLVRLQQQHAAALQKNTVLLKTVQKQSEHNNIMVNHIVRYFKPLNDSLEKVAKELASTRQLSVEEAQLEHEHAAKRLQQKMRRRRAGRPTTPPATPKHRR